MTYDSELFMLIACVLLSFLVGVVASNELWLLFGAGGVAIASGAFGRANAVGGSGSAETNLGKFFEVAISGATTTIAGLMFSFIPLGVGHFTKILVSRWIWQ